MIAETSGVNAPLPAQTAATMPTRPFYWSVRRELWEHRSLYLSPTAIAAVVVVVFFILAIVKADKFREIMAAIEPAQERVMILQIYSTVAIAITLVSVLVGWIYSLDALYSERRDRSILFWKSLPVSDVTAVLAKASIPFVVLPLVTFVVIVAAQFVVLLLHTVFLLANGLSAAGPWTYWGVFHESAVLIYGLFAIALWGAPVYGWLMLISAWAQRSIYVWAIVPPIVVIIVEKLSFGTNEFQTMVSSRMMGSFRQAFDVPVEAAKAAGSAIGKARPGADPHAQMDQMLNAVPDPMKFLSTPGLWLGLAFAAACIAAAIWLRRYRDPV